MSPGAQNHPQLNQCFNEHCVSVCKLTLAEGVGERMRLLAFGTWKFSSSPLILHISFKGCLQNLSKYLRLAFPPYSKIPSASSLVRAPPTGHVVINPSASQN